MKISKDLTIDPIVYGCQGNAILGIKDSGKTYSATFIAEQLMSAGIPIIAFDPIGVWRYLKQGKSGKGFPVVVAGDDGDIPLTPETAPQIVRAAMKENVSLVIDLFSISLSKSDWKRIVEQCVRILLYENKGRGLRHVFIEEAAEFCPQKINPDTGRVYAEIEKLARMGGNSSLGYTLINQRPEEVNKAVLELCECLLLHRQKGRHSITALGKWLDVADVDNAKEITNSLPSLSQGECWVWAEGSHVPVRVKMPEKQTIHPDRKNPNHNTKGVPADVTEFVARIKKAVLTGPKAIPAAEQPKKNKGQKEETLIDDNQDLLKEEYELKINDLETQLATEKNRANAAEARLEIVKKMLLPDYKMLQQIFDQGELKDGPAISTDAGEYKVWLDKFGGKKKDILMVLIERKEVTRQQLGVLVGMSYNSGSFNTYLSELKSVGLLKKNGDKFVLQKV